MGQEAVYKFLHKHRGEWFTNKQISKRTRRSLGSVTRCTSKLFDKGFVIHKRMPGVYIGYMFMVELEINPVLTFIAGVIVLAIAFGLAYSGYRVGIHLNNDNLRATFVGYVNNNIDDPAVAVIVNDCSKFPMNESQVKCVSDFMNNISIREHSSEILTPSELLKGGGVCRDVSVMYAAIFEKLGWGYSFTFPLNEHVFTTVYTDVVCSDSMVDCSVYCNIDWHTYACYRIYNEKEKS